MAVLITDIECSSTVEEKLNNKHQLTLDDVYDALEDHDLTVGWDDDPNHGRRVLARGRTSSGRLIRIFLYPVDEDAGVFRLGTAF